MLTARSSIVVVVDGKDPKTDADTMLCRMMDVNCCWNATSVRHQFRGLIF
jgi:hypothetical protein